MSRASRPLAISVLIGCAFAASGCVAPSDHSSGQGSSGPGAPAVAEIACAKEADRYWNLTDGTAVPGRSKSTGSGLYAVNVTGGKHRGVCTVTAGGDVTDMMNR
jgi:hypothetical protein